MLCMSLLCAPSQMPTWPFGEVCALRSSRGESLCGWSKSWAGVAGCFPEPAGGPSRSLHLVIAIKRAVCLLPWPHSPSSAGCTKDEPLFMGVTFWVDYERLKHLYGSDKGAALAVGSLDGPFKPWHKAGPGGFCLSSF